MVRYPHSYPTIMKRTSFATLIGLSLATASANAATLTSGHVDFIGIGYDGTNFEPHSHAEAGAVVDGVPLVADTEYELGELTVQTSTTSIRPAGAVWELIGVASGESYYSLPDTEVPGQPFIGIGAEELVAAEWSPLTITLTGASGSGITAGGKFSLWQGSLTPTFFMITEDGIGVTDVFTMDLNEDAHAHFGWGFTKEGIYDLTFEIAGIHAVDGAKSATATYSFSVIPEPSSALLGAFGALALLRRRR